MKGLQLTLAILKPDLCMRTKAKEVCSFVVVVVVYPSSSVGCVGHHKGAGLLHSQTG